VEFRFDLPDDSPWGSEQPKFERLVTDGPDRYFLVGQTTAGEPISVQLAPPGSGPAV
jgi:hypothetical protein